MKQLGCLNVSVWGEENVSLLWGWLEQGTVGKLKKSSVVDILLWYKRYTWAPLLIFIWTKVFLCLYVLFRFSVCEHSEIALLDELTLKLFTLSYTHVYESHPISQASLEESLSESWTVQDLQATRVVSLSVLKGFF